ncbi:hypothetical protein [Tsuneonella flava]|uniref:hypothetical protein n=1 Tax=Tsuneonella flava TaxID=2055955 RepID=UPI0012FFE7DD|nr:hypothetical protein [Tsuneonella flava]
MHDDLVAEIRDVAARLRNDGSPANAVVRSYLAERVRKLEEIAEELERRTPIPFIPTP